jgi:hypothetical protein
LPRIKIKATINLQKFKFYPKHNSSDPNSVQYKAKKRRQEIETETKNRAREEKRST